MQRRRCCRRDGDRAQKSVDGLITFADRGVCIASCVRRLVHSAPVRVRGRLKRLCHREESDSRDIACDARCCSSVVGIRAAAFPDDKRTIGGLAHGHVGWCRSDRGQHVTARIQMPAARAACRPFQTTRCGSTRGVARRRCRWRSHGHMEHIGSQSDGLLIESLRSGGWCRRGVSAACQKTAQSVVIAWSVFCRDCRKNA